MGFFDGIKCTLVAGILVVPFFYGATVSYASCLPGLPCVEAAYTGDDPTANPKYNKTGEDLACDADFMNQIYARSYIESEREIAVAGQDIIKPDSVLELSCFDAPAKSAFETYNPYFSADTNLAGAVDALSFNDGTLSSAVSSYISSNYGHSFLNYGGADYSSGASTCDYIMAVQKLARCSQVDTAGPAFFDFSTLVSADPRVVAQTGNACSSAVLTQGVVDVAENKDLTYSQVDVFDDYADIVAVESVCGAPVSTGVVYSGYGDQDLTWSDIGALIFGDDDDREHKICVNPSCYYDPENDSCEEKL